MSLLSLLRKIDLYFGNFLSFFFALFVKKNKKINKIEKILIIRLWTLGESILTIPTIKLLKEHYPQAKIDVLTLASSAEAVFKQLSFINKVHRLNFNKLWWVIRNINSFDLAIDTEPYFNFSAFLSFYLAKINIGYKNNFRQKLYSYSVAYNSNIHAVLNFSKLLSPLAVNKEITTLIPFPSDFSQKKQMMDFLREKNILDKNLIGIHAGTSGTADYRAWPKENFASLISIILKEFNNSFVILGGSNLEKKLNEEIIALNNNDKRIISIAGLFSFPLMIEFYNFFKIFISCDTGPMHLAAAQKIPTIGLFGPNLPQRFGPFPLNKNFYIYHKSEYSPCINVHSGEFKKCPCAGNCMKKIKVEEVYDIVYRILKNL